MVAPDNKIPPQVEPSKRDEADSYIIRKVDRPRDSTSSDHRTDFREVLSKRKKSDNRESKETDEDKPNAVNPSIFDLVSRGINSSLDEEGPDQELLAGADKLLQSLSGGEFNLEQPDLTAVNPNAIGVAALGSGKIEDAPAPVAPRIQDLIDQIVDKIYTVKTAGQTDTVMNVKYPPIFSGVDVVLSAFDTAKGEFNIAFHNLTQEAKRILDMQQNQLALRQALEEKGYLVHIVIVTTKPLENVAQADSAEKFGQGRKGEDEEQQQQKKKK